MTAQFSRLQDAGGVRRVVLRVRRSVAAPDTQGCQIEIRTLTMPGTETGGRARSRGTVMGSVCAIVPVAVHVAYPTWRSSQQNHRTVPGVSPSPVDQGRRKLGADPQKLHGERMDVLPVSAPEGKTRCWTSMLLLSMLLGSCAHTPQPHRPANGVRVTRQTVYRRPLNQTAVCIEPAADGCLIVGDTTSSPVLDNDIYLLRLDAAGSVLWEKSIGGRGDEVPYSVARSQRNGYVIVGMTDSFGHGGTDVYVVNVDGVGNVLWDRTFGGPHDDVGLSVAPTVDGGYLISGTTIRAGSMGTDIYMLRIDGSGNLMWETTWGDHSRLDEGRWIREAADGGCIVIGSAVSAERLRQEICLLNVDHDGALRWSRTHGCDHHLVAGLGSCHLSVSDASCLDPSGYLVAGAETTGGIAEGMLARVDASGDVLWMRIFPEVRGFWRLRQATGSEYLALAEYEDPDNHFEKDFYCFKFDANGNRLWAIHAGTPEFDRAMDVLPVGDKYLLVGYTATEGGAKARDYDIMLVELQEAKEPPP